MPASKTRKKHIRIRIALSLCLMASIIVYVLIVNIGPRWIKQHVLPNVNNLLNGTLSVQDISIHPLSASVNLKNIQVNDIDQKLVLEAQSVKLNLDLLAYLQSKQITIHTLTIDQGHGIIQTNELGQLTLIQTLDPILDFSNSTIEKDTTKNKTTYFQIKRISLKKSKLTIKPPHQEQLNDWAIGPIDASFNQIDSDNYLPTSFNFNTQIPDPLSQIPNSQTGSKLNLTGKRFPKDGQYHITLNTEALDLNQLVRMASGCNTSIQAYLNKTQSIINGKCNTQGTLTISHPSLANNSYAKKPTAYQFKYDGKINFTKTNLATQLSSPKTTCRLGYQNLAWQGSIQSNWPYSFDPALNPLGLPSLMLDGQVEISQLNLSPNPFNHFDTINTNNESDLLPTQNDSSSFSNKKNRRIAEPQIQWQINQINVDSFTYQFPKHAFEANLITIQQPQINWKTQSNKKQDLNTSENPFENSQANPQATQLSISDSKNPKKNSKQNTSNNWQSVLSALNSFKVNQVCILNGSIKLNDQSLNTPTTTTLSNIESHIDGINFKNNQPTHLKANAQINQSGQVHFQLQTILKPQEVNGQINLKLDEIDLKPFTEYSATYLGYHIHQGSLNLDLPLTVETNQLTGQAEFKLLDFKLGLPTSSPQSIGGDLPTAISILRDRQGQISGTVPITGNLLNPDFSISQLATKAVSNLIVRTLTAPIDALAMMFGGQPGVDYSTITFISGDIKPIQDPSQKLQVLANTLIARPEINLAITGRINQTLDSPALENRLRLEAIQNDRTNDLFASPNFNNPFSQAGKQNDQWKQYQNLLLIQLAKKRAEWTRDQLVEQYGVPKDQIQTYTQLNSDFFGEPTVQLSMSNPHWQLLTPEANDDNTSPSTP